MTLLVATLILDNCAVVAAVTDLSDVDAGGETLFPLLHAKDMPFPSFLDKEPASLRKVSAFLDNSGRVTSEQSENNQPSGIGKGSFRYVTLNVPCVGVCLPSVSCSVCACLCFCLFLLAGKISSRASPRYASVSYANRGEAHAAAGSTYSAT